jgi:alkylation response protein AidB-like acyl-CoA dehydrogenase
MNLPQPASSPSLRSIAQTLISTTIAPHADQIDQDSEALAVAFNHLGQSNLLALRVPRSLGGAGADDTTFREFQELLARHSGALAFLQAQHQSAAALLAQSNNRDLQQDYLVHMGSGKVRVGISFAHLRRQPSPVQAIATPDGYRITGESPWVTGYGIFQTFIGAAALPDGRAVYGMVPFRTGQQAGGTIVCGQPMELAALSSTATVTVQFQDWLLPSAQVVSVKPETAIAAQDRLNVLQPSFFALGCAAAGLDILATAAAAKPFEFLRSTHTQLAQELATCRQRIFAAGSATDYDTQLNLRAWAIDLASRCAQAAVTASSGAANHRTHAAQRVYREALAFTVSGQTPAVMAATLAKLTRSNESDRNNPSGERD